MILKFSSSFLFKEKFKTSHAEGLYAYKNEHSVPELLAVILKQPKTGKFTAYYIEPRVQRTFETRDEAANFLVALSSMDADKFRYLNFFLKGNYYEV